jgi:hypothetical protein
MRRDFTADPVLSQIRRAWVFTLLGLTFTLCTVHVWGSVFSFVIFMFGSGVWLITAEQARPDARAPAVPDARKRETTFSRFAYRPRMPRL